MYSRYALEPNDMHDRTPFIPNLVQQSTDESRDQNQRFMTKEAVSCFKYRDVESIFTLQVEIFFFLSAKQFFVNVLLIQYLVCKKRLLQSHLLVVWQKFVLSRYSNR